jgi:hypothetical protein
MSKRERKPRVQSSPASQPQQAAASPGITLAANAYVIHPTNTKHGPRDPRDRYERERAQLEITALYPHALPDRVNKSDVYRKVNKRLRKRGEAEVSRQTVMRALEDLREANR